jgi:hypothetical protein
MQLRKRPGVDVDELDGTDRGNHQMPSLRRRVLAVCTAVLIAWFIVAALDRRCRDCLDPQRPHNSVCGSEWNPTTYPGGFHNLSCDLRY